MEKIRFLQNVISSKELNQIMASVMKSATLQIKWRNFSGTSCKEKATDLEIKTESVLNGNDILTKYRNIINKMTLPVGEAADVCHKTNFGSIRFDDENSPKEYFEENNIENSNDKERAKQYNLNYIDEHYFKLALENYDQTTTITEHAENYLDKGKSIKNHEDILDLNYVDSLYLSNDVGKEVTEKFQDISTGDVNISDLNLVDKQYFIENSIAGNTCLNDGHNLSLNEHIIEGQLSNERVKSTDDGLYSFAQAIDEDFELPVQNLNSTFISKSLGNRSQLENELLNLSESLSTNKTSQNISNKQINFKDETISNPNSTIIKDNKNVSLSNDSDVNNKEETDKLFQSSTQSAYEYIIKKRIEDKKIQHSESNMPANKYLKILNEVPVFKNFLAYDFLHLLRKSVLYNNNDIIALCKPYGVPVHSGDNDKYGKRSSFNIADSLPDLAKLLKTEHIIPVHRLDVNTTGVLLFAKSPKMADTLKKLFVDHKIKKSYLAITKGIPNPISGVINIPIAEGKVENHMRMVLRPDVPGFRGKAGKSRQAITHFKVLSRANNSALVMLNPISGVKHQLRVHLGFGLACPVLGDHKYSHLKKMIPQKLPGDMLDHLQVKQTRVRDLPIYLHAFSVTIPNILDSRDLFVRVGPPKFFKTTMKCLELNKSKNHVNEVPELIFDTVS